VRCTEPARCTVTRFQAGFHGVPTAQAISRPLLVVFVHPEFWPPKGHGAFLIGAYADTMPLVHGLVMLGLAGCVGVHHPAPASPAPAPCPLDPRRPCQQVVGVMGVAAFCAPLHGLKRACRGPAPACWEAGLGGALAHLHRSARRQIFSKVRTQ
jgi:hypothetical protein